MSTQKEKRERGRPPKPIDRKRHGSLTIRRLPFSIREGIQSLLAVVNRYRREHGEKDISQEILEIRLLEAGLTKEDKFFFSVDPADYE